MLAFVLGIEQINNPRVYRITLSCAVINKRRLKSVIVATRRKSPEK